MAADCSRFTLLRHEVPPHCSVSPAGRSSHWDLLLQRGETAWTWALETLPAGWLDGLAGAQPQPVTALRLPDHRLFYLDYEGPLRGDRGTVGRVATGRCQWQEATNDYVRVDLLGSITATAQEQPLNGQLIASRVAQSAEADPWQLLWLPTPE